ncbi:MAG: hypothetical protein Q8L23_07075 [Caulobacter sp.]|nr:hypothetical protein [Caulobacter sp.]
MDAMMSRLSPLESAVAEAISHQYPVATSALLSQLATATVTGRDFTGSGFFTEFEVSRSAPSAPTAIGPVGWIGALVGPDRYPMEFMLYVREGFAHMIEAYSYGDGYGELDLINAEFSRPTAIDTYQL